MPHALRLLREQTKGLTARSPSGAADKSYFAELPHCPFRGNQSNHVITGFLQTHWNGSRTGPASLHGACVWGPWAPAPSKTCGNSPASPATPTLPQQQNQSHQHLCKQAPLIHSFTPQDLLRGFPGSAAGSARLVTRGQPPAPARSAFPPESFTESPAQSMAKESGMTEPAAGANFLGVPRLRGEEALK